MTYRPLFIIGAGRSGTNILRDTLTTVPGWETWPCDEINLIWRHGNRDKRDDVFGESEATPRVKRYMHKVFERFARTSGAAVVVEKTCANSLRVPFIDAIFPEARFVYIVRDGRDVALSAARRWTASVELSYLLKKLPYVPPTDVPYYGLRFLRNRLHQSRSAERRQAAWGPRFPGMDELATTRPLIDVCAKQWATCVEASDAAFASVDPARVHRVRYEDLVAAPADELAAILRWAGADPETLGPQAAASVRMDSAGGWKKKAGQFTPESLELMAQLLQRHGYGPTA